MQAVAYVRVSTAEQGRDGYGLDAQCSAIRAFAERKGWNIAETFRDTASGKTLARRPGLHTALEQLADPSAAVSVLVVAKLDRLARSMLDFATLLERSAREGWHLAVVEPEIDLTTPYGRAMANVIMTFAQLEREMISERTKVAMAEARERGVHTGRPLAMNGRDPVARERIKKALPRMRRLRSAGKSLRVIAEELNAAGLCGPRGGVWHARSVQLALRRYSK